MKTFNAKNEIIKYGKPFATMSGKYQITFTPSLLGSFVKVSSKNKDDLCGDWLLSDLPAHFVVSLGTAAHALIKEKR